MNGNEIQAHRYSHYLRELLEKVRDGEQFELGVKVP